VPQKVDPTSFQNCGKWVEKNEHQKMIYMIKKKPLKQVMILSIICVM
jgi:hypothetical protein